MNFSAWLNSVLTVLKTFRFVDIIDIVVIAFIVYSLFKLVRDTRAEQLVKGIVILLIAYLVATVFNMLMMEILLRTLFEFGVVLLVIIFQPEIRNALEQLGRNNIKRFSLFNRVKRTEEWIMAEKKAIIDVAETAEIFSRQKTGALIVFENETKLSDIASTGVEINADTSIALLGNIFFNKAPLHDGAVIISSGKVKSAGCILPLTSRNEDVDMNLGTRHRASLGITEVSDAVVVVVSEETGTISVSENGQLTSNYSRDSLIEKLESVLIPVEEKKNFFSKFSSRKENKKDE
ncbi:MAG: diadenylate cyclase CdaA [Ruminococcus sp.]|nr:diadenylate cyclase CdaA [Ruminococcus sp.]